MVSEEILVIECAGTRIFGVLHRPTKPRRRGVVMLDRIGVHRQSVLWARFWSQLGIPSLRFDLRGRGDNEGERITIEETDFDVRAAVDAFQREIPEVEEIVLWGISQGASVGLLYAPSDPRVVALAMCNPWLRAERAVARTFLWQRLSRVADREFWKRIHHSEAGYTGAARSLLTMLRDAFAPSAKAPQSGAPQPNRGYELTSDTPDAPLQDRLSASLQRFHGRIILILSGDDPASIVFRKAICTSPQWKKMSKDGRLTLHDLPDANHLFSSREWRDQVGTWTANWLESWS